MGNIETENPIDKTSHWLIVGANIIESGLIEGDINPLIKKLEENLGPNWEQVIRNTLDNKQIVEKGKIDDKIKQDE